MQTSRHVEPCHDAECYDTLPVNFAEIDLFDREVFAMSSSEAVTIDPQQRLLLEEIFIALGDAQPAVAQFVNSGVGESGMCSLMLAELAKSEMSEIFVDSFQPHLSWNAGVYAGCMYSEYMEVIMAGAHSMPPLAVVGSGLSYMVGRISYTFNFTGRAASSL